MNPTAKGKNLLQITTTYQNEYDIEFKQTFDFWINVRGGKMSHRLAAAHKRRDVYPLENNGLILYCISRAGSSPGQIRRERVSRSLVTRHFFWVVTGQRFRVS